MSTKKEFKKVLAASKSESILAVIEGLPVDANGFFLSEEQLTAIEGSLEAAETIQAAQEQMVADHNSTVASLTTERDAATTALATANASITEKENSIVALQAQVKKLEEGTPPPKQTKKDKDGIGQAEASSASAKFADSLLGAPKKAKE